MKKQILQHQLLLASIDTILIGLNRNIITSIIPFGVSNAKVWFFKNILWLIVWARFLYISCIAGIVGNWCVNSSPMLIVLVVCEVHQEEQLWVIVHHCFTDKIIDHCLLPTMRTFCCSTSFQLFSLFFGNHLFFLELLYKLLFIMNSRYHHFSTSNFHIYLYLFEHSYFCLI